MIKVIKVIAVIGIICGGLYAAYWGYVVYQWGQHLPNTTINVNGVERNYYVYLPTEKSAKPMPLIMLLHGSGSGHYRFPQQFRLEDLAEKEGIILALPVAKKLLTNEGEWQLNTDAESMQDIDFIEAVIDDVSASHAVALNRVYALGYSMGSMFSYEIACGHTRRFAAIASYAGSMPITPKSCEPARNIPLMHIHGVQDSIIAYETSWDWKSWGSVGKMHDIPALVQYWGEKYKCKNRTESESNTSAHILYDSCDQNAAVELHRIDAAEHGWPDNINGVSTHEVIWSFLSNYSRP